MSRGNSFPYRRYLWESLILKHWASPRATWLAQLTDEFTTCGESRSQGGLCSSNTTPRITQSFLYPSSPSIVPRLLPYCCTSQLLASVENVQIETLLHLANLRHIARTSSGTSHDCNESRARVQQNERFLVALRNSELESCA